MPSSICMKLMQYIFLDATFSFNYVISIDNRNIIDKTVFEIMRIMKFFRKLNFFSMTSLECKMTSYQKKLSWHSRYALDLSFKTVRASVGPPLWSVEFLKETLLLTFNSSKNTSKWSKIEKVNIISDYIDPVESDEQVTFYPLWGQEQSKF